MDFGRFVAAFILWYPLFLIPASVGFISYYFLTRNISNLSKINWLTMLCPWAIWILLISFLSTGKKSLANLVEASLIGVIVALSFIAWAFIRKQYQVDQKIGSSIVWGVSCLSAFIVFFAVPGLPE